MKPKQYFRQTAVAVGILAACQMSGHANPGGEVIVQHLDRAGNVETKGVGEVKSNAAPKIAGETKSGTTTAAETKSNITTKTGSETKSDTGIKSASETSSNNAIKAGAEAAETKTSPAARTSAANKTAAAPKLKPVMDPEGFFGKASAGYEAAKKVPEICAKVFCYCGCDLTDSHQSLLDCFTSDHGADCPVCQDEAIMAMTLNSQGKTLAQIQRAIDEKFVKEYPYDNPSKALVQYRKTRLWQPASKEKGAGLKKMMLPPPRLKPGKQAGTCCGHQMH